MDKDNIIIIDTVHSASSIVVDTVWAFITCTCTSLDLQLTDNKNSALRVRTLLCSIVNDYRCSSLDQQEKQVSDYQGKTVSYEEKKQALS